MEIGDITEQQQSSTFS